MDNSSDQNRTSPEFERVSLDEVRVAEARRARQRNTIIIIAVVAAIFFMLVVLVIWRWRKSHETEAEIANVVVSVKVAKAEKGRIAAQVVAVGTIWPRDKADVAAKVSAQIKKMGLLKDRFVHAGDVIAVLESRDLQAQRAEAVAALNQARAEERSLVTGTIPKTNAEDQKSLNDARAKVNNARALYDRRRGLYERGGISKKDLDQSQLDLTTAEDELRLAQQTVALRGGSLNPNDRALAAAKTAEAQQHVATLDAQLSYATIIAPIDGVVTRKSVQLGQIVQAGQSLLTIVPAQDIWVTANFKETQLANVQPGQRAEIYVDMYGRSFEGRVDSVASATGSKLSLLPPENATGNFVKIVQRIPVKIAIVDPPAGFVFRPGMNVDATILTK